eukprot:TRINITY_DN11022_c0_g1_i1.p1 TRINITY_DN11022_c0_g1~~TRINITY_DN11022_c0_g1_i1.p1  ORF type:complete len:572 (+),score=75.87 TRINITY_DN11022_c0_g1_i1:149-1864(+)
MEYQDAAATRGGFNLVNRLLFPAPKSNYDEGTFDSQELIWLPRSLDPENSDPHSNVPCLLLTSNMARFLMIYYHSNAEDIGGCYHFCNMLRLQFQVNVLVVEYPGYGLCPGQADEESVIANALLGYRFATSVLGFPPDDIIVIGRSIGSGPALCIASQYPVKGLILICPFLSVKEAVRSHLGRLADLIEERFPNKDRIKQITGSLLIVHGKQDSVVPWTHGEALYEACRRRKRLVTPEDMNHNASLLVNPGCFVVPVLQFFGLPDYNFESINIPPWVFDRRNSPFQHRQGEARDRSVQDSCDVERMAQPSKSRVKDHPDQCVTHTPDAVKEGDIAGGPMQQGPRIGFGTEPPSLKTQAHDDVCPSKQVTHLKDEDAEAIVNSAVHQFLAYSQRPHSKDTEASESPLKGDILEDAQVQPSTADHEALEAVRVDKSSWHFAGELPPPPDDSGFFKVPRSHNAGPTITAPVHLPPTQPYSCVDLPAYECKASWMSGLCSTGIRQRGMTTQELITVGTKPEPEQAAVWRRWADPTGPRATSASMSMRGSTKPVVAFSPRDDIPAEEPEPELAKDV